MRSKKTADPAPAPAPAPAPSKIATEAGLVTAVEKYLTLQGPGVSYLKVAGGPFQRPGVSDLLVCWHGRFAAIELKAPGRLAKAYKPKDTRERLQLNYIKEINQAGGHAGIFDSLGAVIQFLEGIS